jgi:hypothetical protein
MFVLHTPSNLSQAFSAPKPVLSTRPINCAKPSPTCPMMILRLGKWEIVPAVLEEWDYFVYVSCDGRVE